MKPLLALALGLICLTSAQAQETPVTPPAPSEEAKPAAPAEELPDVGQASYSQDEIRVIEKAIKKQMMLVGMGSGVIGLLIGMMIGRKTAPRTTSRRF